MEPLKNLSELFQNQQNTQLMRQEIELYAMKLIIAGDLTFVHSYYERKDNSGTNPIFSAPALIHKIERNNSTVNLTLKTLKDEHDIEAAGLLRSCGLNEIEVGFSHVRPEYLNPKLKGSDWDNWALSYNLPPEKKIERRKARTREVSANLYRNFKKEDFENKRVLFLGCGEGDEIQTLIDYFQLKKLNIYGVDQSKASIEICKTLAEKYKEIKMTFEALDFSSISDIKEKTFDTIIALGVFDRETLEFDYAADLLKKMKAVLSFEDLIIKAYSFDLFNKSHYERLGFEVKQTSSPQTLYTHHYSFFYHLKNSASTPDSVRDTVAEQSITFWS